MLQLKIESLKHRNVYRTILVPGNVSFFKLSFYIYAAFEVEEMDDPIFEVKIKNGEKGNREVIRIDAFDETEYPIEQQYLKDWFVKSGDEIHYTFAEDLPKLKITLEKRVLIPLQSDNPICLEGNGDLLKGNSISIDKDFINEELKFFHQMSDEDLRDSQSNNQDYQGLIQLADELKKEKPWEYFENAHILAFDITDDDIYFVCVMGSGGQEYGIMVFDQYHYDSLYKILSGEPLPKDFHYDLEMMTVNYVNRDELTKEDYQLIKDNGFSFRGKNNWIQFRVYNQGLVPTIPDGLEVGTLKKILKMTLDVLSQCKNGWKYPLLEEHMYPVFSYDQFGKLQNSIIRLKKVDEPPIVPLDIDKQEKGRYKRKPKSSVRLEFDVMYSSRGVKVEEINRIAYPIIALLVDKASGMVIGHNVLPVPKDPYNVQLLLWELLNELPYRPTNVIVSKEIKQMVKGLEKELGVKITVGDLKNIRELVKSTERIF